MSQIKFDTSGWRGILAEDFTLDNVSIGETGEEPGPRKCRHGRSRRFQTTLAVAESRRAVP